MPAWQASSGVLGTGCEKRPRVGEESYGTTGGVRAEAATGGGAATSNSVTVATTPSFSTCRRRQDKNIHSDTGRESERIQREPG
jgi:hypothetical protein